jgi:hypothetical protein
VTGVVLSSAGLSLLTYGVTIASQRASLDSTTTIGPIAGGLLALGFFAVRTLRIASPLLNLRLWRNHAFSGALAVGFFAGGALFGALLLMPLYFEIARGQSTTNTGLLLIGQGLGAAITMPISGRLTDRFGGGVVSVAGLTLTALSVVALTLMSTRTSLVAVEAVTVALGLGLGLALMPAAAAAYGAVTPEQIPDAAPQLNAVQRIGGAIGTAIPSSSSTTLWPRTTHQPQRSTPECPYYWLPACWPSHQPCSWPGRCVPSPRMRNAQATASKSEQRATIRYDASQEDPHRATEGN